MALKRWEIQVLMLLAQEPKSPEAREVFEEYKNDFSADAKKVASQILKGEAAVKNASDRIAKSAEVFLRRGAARTAERETRELAHVV
jgi:hypothetical protein